MVLNACRGASSSATDSLSSLAAGLVDGAIPAAVAMQFDITDRAALSFSRAFYGALADGNPVDTAVSVARYREFARPRPDGGPRGLEWGTPVLYLRASSGQLFEMTRAPGAIPAVEDEAPEPTPVAAARGRGRWIAIALIALAATAALAFAIWPRGDALVDGDGDGHTALVEGRSLPAGHDPRTLDCDDRRASVHPGAKEECNGTDDDCDGATDESFGKEACTAGVGACLTHGRVACTGGKLACDAVASAPGVESCNGRDDDCDGTIDEGVGGEPCREGVGGCAQEGRTICVEGRMRCSVQSAAARNESCNGKDDDCDGTVDEGLGGAQCNEGRGECARSGKTLCIRGEWSCSATAAAPRPEACSGKDEDCDGKVDEGMRNACGQCGPTPREQCDGADNDCDGKVDEGMRNACGLCGPTPREVCDGVDNDCDGKIDEGVTRTYYRDADGDGFGDPRAPAQRCAPGGGWVENSRDCNDTNKNVSPNQTGFFDQPHSGRSFDWNCDGKDEQRHTYRAEVCSCGGFMQGKSLTAGYYQPIPACGSEGKWVANCKYQAGRATCEWNDTSRVKQTCR